MCLDYVAQFVKVGDKNFYEVKLPIEIAPGVRRNGIIDRLMVHVKDRTADVFDFKFGAVAVTDAENNRQGWCYADMTFAAHPGLKMVRVHFPQPKRDEIKSLSDEIESLQKQL